MNEKLKELYIKYFINYINEKVDFSKYESMIEKSNLFFSPSNSIDKNMKSNYYSLLNQFYFDKLDDKDKEILLSKDVTSSDIKRIIEKSYKEVLKKGDMEYVMYNPPIPNHRVKNGSLVFEFVYGKNSEKLNDEQYTANMIKQREFISKTNELLKRDIEEKIGISCEIFVEKRV
ncbi:MAG: hypothetical protein IKF01_01460 [Bacilli bacterium]|nr:hypothetical protein [Bacilli bacterium]MBR3152563.1 hypothetical protein [Clostridia bacterium]